MKSKKSYLYIVLALILGLVLGVLFASPGNHHPRKTATTQDSSQVENDSIAFWTCSMHSKIHQDHPGKCPICGMTLVPVKKKAPKKIAYWTCPMHKQVHLDHAGRCPICEMKLVPVKAGEKPVENSNKKEVGLSEAAAKLADIETTPVREGIPGSQIHLNGKIETNQKQAKVITARFKGRIEKLYVNYEGQKVGKGQPLARVYSPDLMAAEKELIAAKSLQSTQPDYFAAAKKKLRLWGLTSAQINRILTKGSPLEYMDILAPVSGTVLVKNVTLGDYINPGTVLFKLENLHKLWVVFEAYESQLKNLKKGDQIRFTVEAFPQKVFTSKITFINPVLNNARRTAQIRTEVGNSEGILKPGMFVQGQIGGQNTTQSGVLYIPRSAVLWTGKYSVVYVKKPHKSNPTFAYREVTLGPVVGDDVIVKKGLVAGEEVASHGAFTIDATAQLNRKISMMNPPE